MEKIITNNIQQEDKEIIFQGLLDYNLARLDDKKPEDLGIYYKEDEKLVAGLIGETNGNWLLVKYLWVARELRGQDMGSQLLNQAEQTALERGCKYCFLDTFSFQAPGFYKKKGYNEVLTLDEYPVLGKRHYFVKEL